MKESAAPLCKDEFRSYAKPALKVSRLGKWDRFGKHLVLFLLLAAGYSIGFSFDSGDALDTARWMQSGDLARMVEFRHLVQRLFPFWLWQGLTALGLAIEPLQVLRLWDLVTTAASVMLFYCVLREIVPSRVAAFSGTFLYAASHCVWGYAGSGRLYSTSMLLIFGAYYLVLALPKLPSLRRGLAIGAAATLVCFAGMLWLVNAFNSVGVGLLILFAVGPSWRARVAGLALFATAGLLLLTVVTVSCLNYAGIPLTPTSIQQWIAETKTPPTKLDFSSLMKAAYGQAHGILALPQLPYMINGLLRDDTDLLEVGSLPWQGGKFIFMWCLLLLTYVYPALLLKSAGQEVRGRIVALCAPLLINLYFALVWLGTDRQRFLPAMLSIVALGTLSAVEIGRRTQAKWLAVTLGACTLFIASVNFCEVILPSQRKFIVLEGAWKPLRHTLRAADRIVDFGRDMDYQPVITYYAHAGHLSLSNDVTYYDWDRPDWQDHFQKMVGETRASGGRVFVMDRLALGSKPSAAAWSERQHPAPTVKEFSQFLHGAYCIRSAFFAGSIEYFELATSTSGCPVSRPETTP